MYDIILKESKEVAKNTLELSFGKPEGFMYTPGQYCFLDVYDKDGNALMRPMSFSSHPGDDYLRFTMRMGESEFKNVCAGMKVGDRASVLGPKGFFTLVEKEKPAIFLAGGIGITPIISMLRELELSKFDKSVHLIYSNKTEDDTAYMDEIEDIDLPNFNAIFKFTKGGERIDAEKLVSELGELTQYQYYICGGNSFVEAMKQIVRDAGVSMDNISLDNFGI